MKLSLCALGVALPTCDRWLLKRPQGHLLQEEHTLTHARTLVRTQTHTKTRTHLPHTLSMRVCVREQVCVCVSHSSSSILSDFSCVFLRVRTLSHSLSHSHSHSHTLSLTHTHTLNLSFTTFSLFDKNYIYLQVGKFIPFSTTVDLYASAARVTRDQYYKNV